MGRGLRLQGRAAAWVSLFGDTSVWSLAPRLLAFPFRKKSHTYPTFPPSRPRGALPEAFESGAASALGEAALPSRRFAALGVGGRGSRKRRSVDAVLGRSLATVRLPGSARKRARSPGFWRRPRPSRR